MTSCKHDGWMGEDCCCCSLSWGLLGYRVLEYRSCEYTEDAVLASGALALPYISKYIASRRL